MELKCFNVFEFFLDIKKDNILFWTLYKSVMFVQKFMVYGYQRNGKEYRTNKILLIERKYNIFTQYRTKTKKKPKKMEICFSCVIGQWLELRNQEFILGQGIQCMF